jgi:hypothetical protein
MPPRLINGPQQKGKGRGVSFTERAIFITRPTGRLALKQRRQTTLYLLLPRNAIGTVCNYYGGHGESVTAGRAIFRRIKRGKENMTVHDLCSSPLPSRSFGVDATPRHACDVRRRQTITPSPLPTTPILLAIGYPLSFIRLRKAPALHPVSPSYVASAPISGSNEKRCCGQRIGS